MGLSVGQPPPSPREVAVLCGSPREVAVSCGSSCEVAFSCGFGARKRSRLPPRAAERTRLPPRAPDRSKLPPRGRSRRRRPPGLAPSGGGYRIESRFPPLGGVLTATFRRQMAPIRVTATQRGRRGPGANRARTQVPRPASPDPTRGSPGQTQNQPQRPTQPPPKNRERLGHDRCDHEECRYRGDRREEDDVPGQ